MLTQEELDNWERRKRSARMRNYLENNREEYNAYHRAYYAANRDKIAAQRSANYRRKKEEANGT